MEGKVKIVNLEVLEVMVELMHLDAEAVRVVLVDF
jgi:phenylpyruvate tautomerase PptA (4-oxalocrotonate tautomerase family)